MQSIARIWNLESDVDVFRSGKEYSCILSGTLNGGVELEGIGEACLYTYV